MVKNESKNKQELKEFEKYEEFTMRPDFFIFKSLDGCSDFLINPSVPLADKVRLYPVLVHNFKTMLIGTGKVGVAAVSEKEGDFADALREEARRIPASVSGPEREFQLANFKLQLLMMKAFLVEDDNPVLGV